MSASKEKDGAPPAAEEEEWPDDIVEATVGGAGGDDDMYGDMLDSAWIGGLWGVGLLKETESLIGATFFLRDHIERDCAWRDALLEFIPDEDEDEEDEDGEVSAPSKRKAKTMTIQDLKELWAKRNDGKAMHGNVLAAVCVRFGPSYNRLSEQLDIVNDSEPKGERSRKRREVYKAFNLANVLPNLTKTSVIDMSEVVAYLTHYEMVHEIVEIQISRARTLLEGKRTEFATPEYLTELSSSLGMTGLSGKMIIPLCISALEYAGMHRDAPCPIETLEKYCIGRAARGVGGKNQKQSHIRPMLMSLFKPKQFERDQLSAILMKDGRPKGHISAIADMGVGVGADGEARHESVEASRARALQSQIKAKHIMVLVRSLPTTQSEGLISVVKLKAAMTKQYAHLSQYFIDMLCSLWFKPTDSLGSPGAIHSFFFPSTGFTVRVRLPMGGGFRISGKLGPTDVTAKIYKATIKQMFNKLKTMRTVGADSRVPGDVKLFSDEQHTLLIPDSAKACVGNEIDNGSRIYADSAYVAAIIEQIEDDQNDAALGVSKKSSKGGKGSKTTKAGAGGDGKSSKMDTKAATAPAKPLSPRRDDPGSATAPPQKTRKSKDKPGTLQQALDKLMTISEPITVPPNPPFPSLPSEAHTWGIPLMTKYLRDELELPVYEVAFLRSEMTGRKFIEQDEDAIRKAFKMEHSLHAKKIADHALYLRGLVFERSSIIRPTKVADWAPEHVSGWLACKLNCHICALASFRERLDGNLLLSITDATTLVDTFRTVAVEDEEIGRALQGLAALITGMCKVEPVPELKKKKKDLNEEEEKKLEVKRAEAELLRRHQEEENFREYAAVLSSVKEVLHRDFLMPVVPPSPRDEPIKATVDKVGASVSVTVQPAIGADEGDAKGTSRMKEKKKQRQQNEEHAEDKGAAAEGEKENSVPSNTKKGREEDASEDQAAKKVESKDVKKEEPTPKEPKEEPTAKSEAPAPTLTSVSDAVSTATPAPALVDEKSKALVQASHAEFERKLGQLTSLIEAQSEDMRRLEHTAALLREEGAKSEERMHQEQELTRQSIAELRQDRKSTDRALDQMVTKYTQDMETSKQALEGVVSDLQRQRDVLLAKRQEEVVQGAPTYVAPAAAPVAAPAAVPSVDASMPVPKLEVAPRDAPSSSAPASPALRAPAPEPAVPTGMSLVPVPVPAPAPVLTVAPPHEVEPELKDATAEEDVPLVEFKSVGQLLGYGSQRALQDASDLVVYGGKKPKSSEHNDIGDGTGELPSPAKASQDFQALFQQVAAGEVGVWRSLLARYVHRSPSTLMVSETSAQMGRVSTLWMRLGCRMLDDMRRGPNDGTTASSAETSKGLILAVAGVDAEVEVEEEDEDGLSTTLTQPMVDGLKGLERCARALLGIDDSMTTVGAPMKAVAAAAIEDGPASDPYLGLMRRKLTVGSNAEIAGKDKKLSESLQRKQKRQTEKKLLKEAKQHSRVRQGVVMDSHRTHDYDIAAGMVFCLGLAKRLMDKYPSKADHTHLLYLFTHLREGTLPLNELSRDNLRSLISNMLNITLPSWPQFDSLCQRWDPEGKGFVGAPSVVHALKNVNPLGDGLGPGDYQGIVLLTLSTTEKQLGTLCKRMDAGFLDVIFGAAARVASFDTLVGGKKQGGGSIEAEDFDDWDDWADGDEVTEEEQERRSMKMADEVQLVTDLLVESSRAFFVSEEYTSNDFAHAHHSKASTSGRGGIAATTHSFRRDQPSTACPLCFVPPTPHTLLSACNLTARGLQIYEGRREPILAALETLSTIHMLFRLMVLSRLRDEEEGFETKAMEASIAASKKGATAEDLPQPVVARERSTMRLTVPQILDQIAYVETDLKQLLGDQKSATIIKQANSGGVNLEEVERLLSELLGCPLPEYGVLGLYTSQVEVECFIYHKHTARVLKEAGGDASGHAVGTGAVAVAEKHKVHYQMALSEISATLAEELRSEGSDIDAGSETFKNQKMKTTVRISSNGKPIISSKDLAQTHLLTEMADLMHRQRVDQCAVMLDHLNSKAARRKRTLEASLSLLESLKVQIPGAKVVSNLVDPKNLVVLSVEEICKRTNDLKRMVEQDMAARPTEAIKQLTKKINGFKIALRGGTIKDEDGALTMILQEVGTLENHVVQASSDCLELISVILLKAADHS